MHLPKSQGIRCTCARPCHGCSICCRQVLRARLRVCVPVHEFPWSILYPRGDTCGRQTLYLCILQVPAKKAKWDMDVTLEEAGVAVGVSPARKLKATFTVRPPIVLPISAYEHKSKKGECKFAIDFKISDADGDVNRYDACPASCNWPHGALAASGCASLWRLSALTPCPNDLPCCLLCVATLLRVYTNAASNRSRSLPPTKRSRK